LAELRQAFFVDIDNDDRLNGFHAGVEHLKRIERSDAYFFESRRVSDPERRKRNQKPHAKQSGVPDPSIKPAL
jgi:hypothetical protein